jgi:hypothetical protein
MKRSFCSLEIKHATYIESESSYVVNLNLIFFMTKKTSEKKKASGEQENDFTVGDSIMDAVDAIYKEEIETGKLFEKSIEEITHRMDENMLNKFFDRIDSYDLITLRLKYKLDSVKVGIWLKEYINFRIKYWAKNNKLINHRTTNTQVILYYYLVELKIIDIDKLSSLIPDAINKAALISFIFNKDVNNVRKSLRDANIIEKEKDYYTEKNLTQLLELAEDIKCDKLIDLINRDLVKSKKGSSKK